MYKERVLRPLISNGSIRVTDLRKRLQDLASSKVGVIREGKILEQALEELQEIREQIPEITIKNKSLIYNREWARALELESMTYTLEFIARSSLERKESRASLYRKDFPTTDNNEWCKGVSIEKRDGGMKLVLEPVRITTMEPPRGIYRYGFLEEKEKIDEERDKGQG
jgi:succinate dehydrogenase/fumarate reductase flavoprotein subunit